MKSPFKPIWKPHALATPHAEQIALRIKDKVVATTQLADVPAGTEGRVLLANGFNWQPYRILFNNGNELGDLDARHRAPLGRAAKRMAQTESRA